LSVDEKKSSSWTVWFTWWSRSFWSWGKSFSSIIKGPTPTSEEISIFRMEGGAVGHNFERDPPRDQPCQVWFNLVQEFQRRFKCDLLSKYA
jgi:hypothetical protein